MNASTLLSVTLAGAWLTVACWPAQIYDVTWTSIGGTAGRSTAGTYTLDGTVGKPTVARVNSRNFTIDGGYWSIIAAIQEPGAPLLSVRLTETNTVVVSWPITWPGYVLTENPDVNTANWTPVPIMPNEVAVGEDLVDKQVVVPMPAGNRWYRLRKP